MVPVLKDAEREHPVPSAWRPTLTAIANALVAGNYQLNDVADTTPLDESSARDIEHQIRGYGGTLIPLPGETWNSSVAQWQLDYWEVIVDLFTLEEGRSDLILHVNVFERANGATFNVHFVYVQ